MLFKNSFQGMLNINVNVQRKTAFKKKNIKKIIEVWIIVSI